VDEGYTLDAAAKKVNQRCLKIAEVFNRISASKSDSTPAD